MGSTADASAKAAKDFAIMTGTTYFSRYYRKKGDWWCVQLKDQFVTCSRYTAPTRAKLLRMTHTKQDPLQPCSERDFYNTDTGKWDPAIVDQPAIQPTVVDRPAIQPKVEVVDRPVNKATFV